jgi:hypothetical protein
LNGRDPTRRADLFSVAHRAAGSVGLMDQALLLLRRARLSQLLRGWAASLPLATLFLLVYYLERIEGMRAPLLPVSGLVVIAFVLRFMWLSRLARELVQAAQPGLPLSAAAPNLVHSASSALLSAFGLWLWAWPTLILGRLSIFAVVLFAPCWSLRGAIAPAFIARAACAPETGLAAWLRALDDNRGARGTMLGLEFLVSLAVLWLFANLWAFGAASLLLASSVLGLDVAFLAAFIAPDNDFVLLLLLGASAVLVEPLRAAVSALAFSEARSRTEGADLQAAIDALPSELPLRSQRPEPRAPLLAALVCGAGTLLALAGPALAQPAPADDQRVREHVQHILARGEFHDFGSQESERFVLSEWLERLFGGRSETDTGLPSSPGFEVRVPPALVVGVAIVLLALVIVYVSIEVRRAPKLVVQTSAPPPPIQRSLPPSAAGDDASRERLAQAASLARAGQYAEALRVLYGTTLWLLARARAMPVDVSQTNGQYVRALPPGVTREQFALFTQLFERIWYGKEPASQADYELAAQCSERVREQTEQLR